MKKRKANVWISKKSMATILCMAVSILLLIHILEDSGMKTVADITRPDLAEGSRSESVVVVREDGEQIPLRLNVNAKEVTESEAAVMFAEAMAGLPEMIRAENVSLEQVKTDMILPTRLELGGIQLQWRSMEPELINHGGRLIEKREMEGPETVLLEVTMTLQDHRYVGAFSVTVWPEEAPSWEERLSCALEQAEMDSRETSVLSLPESFEGERVSFAVSEDRSKGVALALLPAILGLLILNGGGQREDKLKKKRREEITADYPELIIKMTVLYQAGLSMRGVWERIAADARRNQGRMRPIYEEVCFACNCMAEGISEPEVYRQFGHRCSTSSCLKLGNLLAGNVRRGTKQLSVLMAQESARAWELRKHRARRNGEKAGTKMLLPMFMMFGVVLAMVVIPAFYSFMI